MNLKKSMEGYMRSFGMRKGKEDQMQLYYNLKKKR